MRGRERFARRVSVRGTILRPKKAPLRKGKSPKRCQWQKKRGDFEEVPRLAATIVAGNRLARRWAGWREAPEGSPRSTLIFPLSSIIIPAGPRPAIHIKNPKGGHILCAIMLS